MIVFDLICTNQHPFEGWFASADEFHRQREHGMISCPVCRDRGVEKRPSPVRFNRLAAPANTPGAEHPSAPTAAHFPQADLQRVLDLLLANTEDVGTRFPEEARRIHYGMSSPRGIRGQAAPEELAALEDEGIEVLQLPVPAKRDWH